jgi:predicted RNA-binding Zn ribbon-like protein
MGDVHAMLLTAGHPALEFLNTLGGRKDGPDDEYLHGYADLVVWSRRAGLIDDDVSVELADLARRRPREADAALAAALELRSHLDAVLRATLARRVPSDRDLDALQRAAVESLGHATLRADFTWTWAGSAPRRPLWPLAHTSLELLRTGPLDRLAECERCRWLFLDFSRNRSRRWCSMQACGAVVKMRRHRAKH